MGLSQKVHGLIESLPDSESSALASSLNVAAVNLPTSIALSIVQQQPANIRDLVSLQTQLELVDRIYPALDTAEVAQSASVLLARLQDPAAFRQTIPKPEPTPLAIEDSSAEQPLELASAPKVPPANQIDLQSS